MSRALLAGLLVLANTALATTAGATADLRYLQHSGWVVRTAEHILVFDYVESLPQGNPLPSDLRLTAGSFDKRKVVVFVSHGHTDHFSPVIREWASLRPDILYVSGGPVTDLPEAKIMKPRETWSSGGLVVKTTGSTDEGVGFLVIVDGLTLYHAGDHARWAEATDAPFMAEIQWLKDTGHAIDIAFFPVATGASCDPRPSIWAGVRSAAQVLAPRVLVPMHVGCPDRLNLYERFRSEIGPHPGAREVVAAARIGESFRYASGRMRRDN